MDNNDLFKNGILPLKRKATLTNDGPHSVGLNTQAQQKMHSKLSVKPSIFLFKYIEEYTCMNILPNGLLR